MTPSEYEQLVEFIAKRFDRVDARLDGHDARFESMDARFDRIEARLARVDVTGEQTRQDLGRLIERVDLLDAKVERHHAETKEEFALVHREIRDTADFWGRRIESLERRVGEPEG